MSTGEGHEHTPPELNSPKCLGDRVLMHQVLASCHSCGVFPFCFLGPGKILPHLIIDS